MKLEITTNPKHVEVANMLLRRAIESLIANPELQKAWQLTPKDIQGAEMFRKKVLNAFTKAR